MNKNALTWIIAAVIILGLGWYLFAGEGQQTEENTETPDTEQQQEEPAEETATPTTTEETTPTTTDETTGEETTSENTWTGILRESDDKPQGNLMLVLENEQVIYINTSRDYSSLIGKEVVVEYEGSLESFTLVDIKEK